MATDGTEKILLVFADEELGREFKISSTSCNEKAEVRLTRDPHLSLSVHGMTGMVMLFNGVVVVEGGIGEAVIVGETTEVVVEDELSSIFINERDSPRTTLSTMMMIKTNDKKRRSDGTQEDLIIFLQKK